MCPADLSSCFVSINLKEVAEARLPVQYCRAAEPRGREPWRGVVCETRYSSQDRQRSSARVGPGSPARSPLYGPAAVSGQRRGKGAWRHAVSPAARPQALRSGRTPACKTHCVHVRRCACSDARPRERRLSRFRALVRRHEPVSLRFCARASIASCLRTVQRPGSTRSYAPCGCGCTHGRRHASSRGGCGVLLGPVSAATAQRAIARLHRSSAAPDRSRPRHQAFAPCCCCSAELQTNAPHAS